MGATPLLLHQKRETFWQTKVESERATPRRLWQSIDSLIGRGHDIVPLSTSIDAPKLHRYFDEKIAGVRASTAHAAPPSYVAAPSHCEFPAFRVLTNDDVIAAICKLPDKQCATDPLTANLLKDKINVDVLAPFITELFKRSMSPWRFHRISRLHSSLQQFVGGLCSTSGVTKTPLLKKPNLDPSDVKSYRPISNLSVLSKLATCRSAAD